MNNTCVKIISFPILIIQCVLSLFIISIILLTIPPYIFLCIVEKIFIKLKGRK